MSEPTVICVLGMHRSGTSLVTRVLHLLGTDLGPKEHLMRPSSANPTGHWESLPVKEINDQILARFGGTWSEPPQLPPGWESRPGLADLRRSARTLIEEDFSGADPWGFKDPRVCLTAPFWQRLVGRMRYVICIRNPVDVAASLEAREVEPIPAEQGMQLWLTYVRAALAASAGSEREFVFYEDLMTHPKPVVKRLARFTGVRQTKEAKAEARAAIRLAVTEGLWHHRSAVPNVVDTLRLPFQVKALYLALRQLVPGPEPVGDEAIDLFAAYAADDGRRRRELEAGQVELAQVRERLLIAEQERSEMETQVADQRAELDRRARAEAEAHRRRQKIEEELSAAQRELERLREPAEEEPRARDVVDRGKDRSADALEERVDGLIPSGSSVLVAAKGDDRLVDLKGVRGMHFPANRDGRYLGYHPAGDTAAIAQLEAQRAWGADYLLLPTATLWWLDHYRGLRRHLMERYETLVEDEECAIFRLARKPNPEADPLATIRSTVDTLRIRHGRNPSILDWRSGLDIGRRLPEMLVFAPPEDTPVLPYLDGTIDVVVLSESEGGSAAEARRVATDVVITVDSRTARTAVEWMAGAPSGWGADVDVQLAASGDPSLWAATVAAFDETLGSGFEGEVTLTGDAGLLAATTRAAPGARVRTIEVESGSSLSDRFRAAVSGSTRPFSALVTEPTVPLPEWLPSMLGLFAREDSAGVIGARTLSSDGSLQEAGGVLEAGHRRFRGQGDSDPDRPEYCFVQRVDFTSAPVIATRRDVFERLGGFNGGGAAGQAVTDFTLRAGQAGASVYYQPDARVVAIARDG